MPEINLREWLNHTSKMLIFDWMPLTYFTFASMLAPRDNIGCYHYAQTQIKNLMLWVFAPVLFMRFIGLIFMNKRHLIIYQVIIIYGYLTLSLSIWDI